MIQGKDPRSMRSRLGDEQFRVLTVREYRERMEIVAGRTPGDRGKAKEELFLSQLKLIEGMIGRVLGDSQGIGFQGRSDVLQDIAGTVWRKFSQIAADADKHDIPLQLIVASRAAQRVIDRIRREKNKPPVDFRLPELVGESGDHSLGWLARMIEQEAKVELHGFFDQLDETASRVIDAYYFGIGAEQHLPMTRIAESLGIPVTTAKSALERGLKKLRKMWMEVLNGEFE
ncbi:MAG: sigma-70 family RNA polymerase sigma factor [Planctomycetota bacterium]|nr:sigma-70 family RNA polymerase sigma factor [Planctomycetota bacterium]